ncbi:MAG: tripartite tricarboxylate transporter substrate binding protein, partial [Betaproteobacteria bacterium]|nr:tripartite tricarboxylate transporter substrate binding protein [Betaproteobacteria bacterium]
AGFSFFNQVNRPMEMIVPSTPGQATDLIGRTQAIKT